MTRCIVVLLGYQVVVLVFVLFL